MNIRSPKLDPEMEPEAAEPAAHADPLSDSLLYLAAHHGRALSRSALLAGLPVDRGILNAALYERAAQRAGLEAQLMERRLSDIPALVLPAVLLLHDGSTRILLGIDPDAGRLTLANPYNDDGEVIERLEVINEQYAGFSYFVTPASVSDPRAVATGDLPKVHWFWSVVRRFGANYSHVAIAAFIVNMLALAAPLFTMSVYDRVIPNGAIPSLVALGVGLALAIAFDFLLKVVRSRIIDMTGKKIDVVLAANIFEHTMAVKMDKRPPSVGILANQIRDFDSVREFFTSGTVVSATDMVFAILFICRAVHHRRPAGLDSAGDAAGHDLSRTSDPTSAGPRDAAAAGGIGRPARHPGRILERHRNRARGRWRKPRCRRCGNAR